MIPWRAWFNRYLQKAIPHVPADLAASYYKRFSKLYIFFATFTLGTTLYIAKFVPFEKTQTDIFDVYMSSAAGKSSPGAFEGFNISGVDTSSRIEDFNRLKNILKEREVLKRRLEEERKEELTDLTDSAEEKSKKKFD